MLTKSLSSSIEHTLTNRWYPLRYHKEQHRLWNTQARFVLVAAGRRSGKTELAKRRLVLRALNSRRNDDWFVAAAPTFAQAKRIFWRDLKRMIPRQFMSRNPSESELTITLLTGTQISVIGFDKPERVEGSPLSGIVMDEFGNMMPDAWEENVRPALADRRGWAWLQGVPEGRNHFYELWLNAQLRAKDTHKQEWDTFHWISADILPEEEILSARASLDPLTYRQEFEADFVTFSGMAYYPFSIAHHVKQTKYKRHLPLEVCFDFNVSPGVAVIAQEFEDKTHVVGEVYIPKNSNTPAVCRKIISMFPDHEQEVHCYGDATGGAAGTAKTSGTDWDIIKQYFYRHYGGKVIMRVPDANPQERVRVNAVNSRLQAMDGTVSVVVDPSCAKLIRDFEGVTLLEGGSGEIDKKTDPKLTHLTDAFGYYIVRQFPIHRRSFSVETI